MKEFERQFKSFRDEFPALGDVIIMSMALEGKKLTKAFVQKAFNKLVSKEEYEQDEKREIIDSLMKRCLS